MRRILAVAAALLVLLAGSGAAAADRPRHFLLEVDIAIERGGMTAAYLDFGDSYGADRLAATAVPPGMVPQTVRLQLPTRPIRNLRFDPTADDSPVVITGMRLANDRGDILLHIDPRSLRPAHQVQAVVPIDGGVRIEPVPKSNDPQLKWDLAPLQRKMHEAMHRPTVTPGVVLALGLVVGGLLVTAVVTSARAMGNGQAWRGGAAILCFVFGMRLLWLNLFSRAVPYWDEWEGDALYILIPFTGGFLDWGALFMPQWEHRILLTRVVTLVGTLLNGEWDPRVAMTVSAGMFATTIALVSTMLLATRRRMATVAAVSVTAWAALPFDSNNVLWGGQTQMYGLVLLAVGLLGLAAAPAVTTTVRVGAAAGSAISLFTMGAGLVAPGLAAGICIVRGWFDREQRRSWHGLAAIFLAAAVVGLFLHTSSAAHRPLYAATPGQFWHGVAVPLAWPLPPGLAGAALLVLPWLIHVALTWRRRQATSLEWLAIGLGAWGLVNAVALGYARQFEMRPLDSRFFTALGVGVLGAITSSVALALRAGALRRSVWPQLAWGVATAGMVMAGVQGIGRVRVSRQERGEMETNVRHFLATGDPAPLLEKPPHFTGGPVVERLESPVLQKILPAPYRRMQASREPGPAGEAPAAGPVTLTVRTLMKIGPAIAALGLMGLGWHLWRNQRKFPDSASHRKTPRQLTTNPH